MAMTSEVLWTIIGVLIAAVGLMYGRMKNATEQGIERGTVLSKLNEMDHKFDMIRDDSRRQENSVTDRFNNTDRLVTSLATRMVVMEEQVRTIQSRGCGLHPINREQQLDD